MLMLSACAVELDVTQTVPDPTGSGEDEVYRATPEPATAVPALRELSTAETLPVETPEPIPTIITEEEIMIPTASVSSGLQKLVDLAVADLAQRLSIAADQIDVIEVEEVVWPDTSLGCPQPGMRYRQVPMDGLLIRLAVGDQVYDYHSGGGRAPFLCEQTIKAPKVTPIDLGDILPAPGSEND
jgi:hypothetical protein